MCAYIYIFFPHNNDQAWNPLNPSIKSKGSIYFPSFSCIFLLSYLPQLVFPREKSCRPYSLFWDAYQCKVEDNPCFLKSQIQDSRCVVASPRSSCIMWYKIQHIQTHLGEKRTSYDIQETNTSPYVSWLLACLCLHAHSTHYRWLARYTSP